MLATSVARERRRRSGVRSFCAKPHATTNRLQDEDVAATLAWRAHSQTQQATTKTNDEGTQSIGRRKKEVYPFRKSAHEELRQRRHSRVGIITALGRGSTRLCLSLSRAHSPSPPKESHTTAAAKWEVRSEGNLACQLSTSSLDDLHTLLS